MGTFTLARGLREVRRIQLAKEEQAKRQAGNGKGKNSEVSSAPEHEKARLLSSESRDALGLQTEPDLEARLPRDVPRPPVRTGSTPDQRSGSPEESTIPQPLMSPTTTESPMGALSKSEKAKGKMPDRTRSESLELSDGLDRIAATGIGRNGFVPTQDWVASWHHGWVSVLCLHY